MKEQCDKLFWNVCELDMLINIFSDAYIHCMDENKSVDHLFLLNQLIVKKSKCLRHKCEEVGK